MGSEFQNLFQRGTTAWAVKYFKEEILTGLVEDLKDKTQTGIDDDICLQIQNALRDAITSVRVNDTSMFRKNFRERLDDFLDIYCDWNNQSDPLNRGIFLSKMRKRKIEIFDDFYDYIDNLAKSQATDSKRKTEYTKLLKREQEINNSLSKSLNKFVEANPDFTNLASKLATFDKRNVREDAE